MIGNSYNLSVLVAIGIGLFSPAVPWLGTPSNLAALLLFFCLFFGKRINELHSLFYGLLLIGSLVVLSTIAGFLLTNQSYTLNINPIAVFIRIQICFLAICGSNNVREMQTPLLFMGVAASLFAIGQFFFPYISEITRLYYLNPERSIVFGEMESGELVRVVGPYENPTSVALACMVMLIFTIHVYHKKYLSLVWVLIFVMINIMAGLYSFSKLFFAVMPLLIIQLFILGYRKITLIVIFFVLVFWQLFLTLDTDLVNVVQYAFNAAFDPNLSFDGRYLPEQISIIFNSFVFGYGIISIENIIINDSLYLSMIYQFGVFGLCLIIAHLGGAILRRILLLPISFFLLITIILIAGLGANSIIGYRVDIFITAFCSVLYASARPLRKKY
jgi:hypothetical protein